jgi:hypothetical protein
MATCTSVQNGLWNDPDTWDNGVPDETSDVVIASGTTVELNVSGIVNSLTCGGGTITVTAPDGLTLEAVVSIDAGVTANGGSGFIQVGTVSDGQTFTITSPVFYGSTSETTGSMLVVSYSNTGKLILNGNCMAKNSGIVWTRGRINLEVNGTEHGFVPGAKTIAEGANCIQSISTYTKIVGDLLGGDSYNTNTYYIGSYHVFSEIYGNCYGGSAAPETPGELSLCAAVAHSRYDSSTATTTIIYGNLYGGSAENAPAVITGINLNRKTYVYGDIQASDTSPALWCLGSDYALLGYGNNLRDSAGNIEPLSSETITAINYVEGIGFGWLITAAVESIDDLVAIEAAGLMLGKFVQVADIFGDWEGYWPIGSSLAFEGEYNGYDYISGNAYKIIGPSYTGVLYDGLFSLLSGTVKNVQIVGLDISSEGPVGGLAAYANGATITRCSVRGELSGSGYFGGLCGEAYDTSFAECYCHVTADGDNVGLIGYGVNNTYEKCYHTKEGDGNGIYASPAQLKTKATFVGWDFDEVWNINPEINDGYPYLDFSVRKAVKGLYRRIHSLTGLKLTGWNLFKN